MTLATESTGGRATLAHVHNLSDHAVLQLLALTLLSVSPAFAQEWSDFTSKVDRFTVNLPGQPTVEEIKWQSEYDAVFPGRVYTS